MIGETLVNLGRRGIKALALLTVAEATVLVAVEVFETVRRKYFWEQPPDSGVHEG